MIDLPPNCDCVMLFDGVCHLCNGTVRFILEHDPKGRIHFAPIQSDLGRRLYSQHGLNADAPETLLLVTKEKVFRESGAVIEIGRRVGGLWKLVVCGQFIPRAIRDAVYRFVARNRYRWFGKHDVCLLPPPELRCRMLS